MSFERTIFLTGFPGFIAERLVQRLAAADTQFFLLVQPAFVDRAVSALEQIASQTGVPIENFALVEGDITKPSLGISDDDLATVRESTTDVFHLAAIYDLAVEKDAAYKVNLEGTKNVNDLVRTLPNLRRYNYISTCYVAGKRGGEYLKPSLSTTPAFATFMRKPSIWPRQRSKS